MESELGIAKKSEFGLGELDFLGSSLTDPKYKPNRTQDFLL